MSEYFPKSKSFGANVKVELDLSNYALIHWILLQNTDLANLKSDLPSNLSNKVDK